MNMFPAKSNYLKIEDSLVLCGYVYTDIRHNSIPKPVICPICKPMLSQTVPI